ncbi:MAG: phosphate transporter permease, partial [Deltaproteobacteria bacterium]|nr:phosphate transporter permease [Deltaproteobacteria bacterium]
MRQAMNLQGRIARNKTVDRLFVLFGLLATFVGLLTLAALMTDLAIDGIGRLSREFFTSFPSRFASRAGILSAWVGTILVMIVTAFTAVPLGVAAGIYLEEYAPKNWLTAIIEINIANLAGVPSIVYGLMALGL